MEPTIPSPRGEHFETSGPTPPIVLDGGCMRNIVQRLEANGIVLPQPPRPVGAYEAVVMHGRLGFVSGQFPLVEGRMWATGLVGREVSLEAARTCARHAALNVLAQIRQALGGWSRFAGLCRVDGVIAADAAFTGHAQVLDAASETLVEVLGARLGGHARSATSAPALPGEAPIELICTFATAPR
jgi:enamine deaminase RidA (YjgF/YER057c/UK114 family)